MANKHKTGTDFWDRDWHGNFTIVGGVKYGDGLLTRPGFAPGHFNERPIATMTDRGGSKVSSKFYLKSGAEGVASMAGRTNTMLPPSVGGGMVNRRNSGLTGWSRGLFLTGVGSKLPWEHVNSLLGTSRLGHSASERFRLNRDEESRRVSLQRVTKDGWVNAKVSDVISDKDELARSGLSPDTDISSSYSPKPRKGARLLNYSEDVSGMLNGVSDRGRVVTVENERLADKIKSFGDGLQNVIKLALDKVREASAESGKTAGGQVSQSNGDNSTPSAKRAKDTANVTAQLIGKAIRHPIDFLSTMSKGLASGFAKNNTALAMSNRFLRRFGVDLRMLRGFGMPGLIGGAAYGAITLGKKIDEWQRGNEIAKGKLAEEGAKRTYHLDHYGIGIGEKARIEAAAAKFGIQDGGKDLVGKVYGGSQDFNDFNGFSKAMGDAGISVKWNDAAGNMLSIGKRIKELRIAQKNKDPNAFTYLNGLAQYFGGYEQLNAIEHIAESNAPGMREKDGLQASVEDSSAARTAGEIVATKKAERKNLYEKYVENKAATEALKATSGFEQSYWTADSYGLIDKMTNFYAGWGGSFKTRMKGIPEKIADHEDEWNKDLAAGKPGAIGKLVYDSSAFFSNDYQELEGQASGRFKGFEAPFRMSRINNVFKEKMGRNMLTGDYFAYAMSPFASAIENDEQSISEYVKNLKNPEFTQKLTELANMEDREKAREEIQKLFKERKEKWRSESGNYRANFSLVDSTGWLPEENKQSEASKMARDASSFLPTSEVGGLFGGFEYNLVEDNMQANASKAKDAATTAIQANASAAKDAASSAMQSNVSKAKDAAESGQEAIGSVVGSDGKPIKATGDNVQNTFMCEIHNDIANPNASSQDIAEKTKQVLAQWYVQTVVPNIPTPN